MATLDLKKTKTAALNGSSPLQSKEHKICQELLQSVMTFTSKLEPEKIKEEILPLLEVFELDGVPFHELTELLNRVKITHDGVDHFQDVLPIYDKLMHSEDSELQTFALEHFNTAVSKLKSLSVTQHVLPFVERISTDEWSTTRALAGKLYYVCYLKASEPHKDELLSKFLDLCQDEDAYVRLRAVEELCDFAKKLDFKRLHNAVIPVFIKVTEDHQESIRVLAIDTFFGVSSKLIPRNVEQLLMPAMRKLFSDKSFNVRCKLAERIAKLQKSVGAGLTKSDLIPAFINFLKDSKAEVKSMALHSIVEFCNNLDPTVREPFLINDALPLLKELICDRCQHVRVKSSIIPYLAQYLKPEAVKSHLVPLISKLIGDDFPKVVRTTLYNLDALKKVLGAQELSDMLISDMEKLANHQHVSHRLSFMENLPLLAEKLGPEFFSDQMTSLCISGAVGNNCHVLQESAVRNLALVVKILGDDWFKCTALPKMQQTSDIEDVTLIQYFLNLMEVIVGVCDAAEMSEELASIIIKFSAHKVNSVRNHVVKLLHNLVSNLNGKFSQHDYALNKIKAHLEQSRNDDSDPDIKSMAAETLEAFFSSKNASVGEHLNNLA